MIVQSQDNQLIRNLNEKMNLKQTELDELIAMHNNSPTKQKYREYSTINPFFLPMMNLGLDLAKEIVFENENMAEIAQKVNSLSLF